MSYEDEDEYGFPPRPPEPPTERDGIRVGDQVDLVTHHGATYPVRVVAFTLLPCCMVVEWLGLRPLSGLSADGRNTICTGQLKEVRRS